MTVALAVVAAAVIVAVVALVAVATTLENCRPKTKLSSQSRTCAPLCC